MSKSHVDMENQLFLHDLRIFKSKWHRIRSLEGYLQIVQGDKEDRDFIFSLFLIFQTFWYIGKVMNGSVGGNRVDGGEVFFDTACWAKVE